MRGDMARTLHLVCQLCGDQRWVQAAPVTNHPAQAHALVGEFSPVPCWACGPTKLKVIA